MKLSVAGYTFENQPSNFSKRLTLANQSVPFHGAEAAKFYQSPSQKISFSVRGALSTVEQAGKNELDELQDLAIQNGEVYVDFQPFFAGTCVIKNDPFSQDVGQSEYRFQFQANTDDTDPADFPSHEEPQSPNTFRFGSFSFGYEPESVTQNYDRQVSSARRLEGITRAEDTEGLVAKVDLSGRIDGGGQATLWERARDNVMAFLSAEFQDGFALIDQLRVSQDTGAPDYINGLYQYNVSFFVVQDNPSGISNYKRTVNRTNLNSGEYVSDCKDDAVLSTDGLDWTLTAGTGELSDEYVEWRETTGTFADDATNRLYVEVVDGFGEVKQTTGSFPSGVLKLYTVDTASGSVDSTTDERACLYDRKEGGTLNFRTKFAVKAAGGDSTDGQEEDVTTSKEIPLSDSVDMTVEETLYKALSAFTTDFEVTAVEQYEASHTKEDSFGMDAVADYVVSGRTSEGFTTEFQVAVDTSHFDVNITNSPTEVTPGGTADIDADITNLGTDKETQTVTLEVTKQ
jgi:hypothetical protein